MARAGVFVSASLGTSTQQVKKEVSTQVAMSIWWLGFPTWHINFFPLLRLPLSFERIGQGRMLVW